MAASSLRRSLEGGEVYDVAISFADSDRAFAEEIARRLERRGVSVYYYAEARPRVLGEQLYRKRRLGLSELLINYNTLFVETMLECQGSYGEVEEVVRRGVEGYGRRWGGVVRLEGE